VKIPLVTLTRLFANRLHRAQTCCYTHVHRLVKDEPINRDGGDVVQRGLSGDDAANDIHLAHQSTAKYFAGRVGVGRHGERAQGEIAGWFLWRGFIVRKVR
jgi:hypothetical protein